MYPQLYTTASDEYFAQSATGVLTRLTPGRYRFGICMASPTSSLLVGATSGTVTVIAG